MMHIVPTSARIIKRQDGIYKPMMTVRHAGEDDLTPDTCDHIALMVNTVYGDVEGDLWKPDTSSRTSSAEIRKNIENGEMLIAEIGDTIIGVCKIGRRDNDTCEFGMLTVDPMYRSIGVGRDLVEFAENWGRKEKARYMRLELLTPRIGKNQSKEFLKTWYGRIGYKPTNTIPFEQEAPHRKDDFLQECDFTVWLKDLSDA